MGFQCGRGGGIPGDSGGHVHHRVGRWLELERQSRAPGAAPPPQPFKNRTTFASLATIEIPTLLVRGRSSDLLSEEGAQDFLRRVSHADFADVAGAGHMVAGDRNEIFNRAILDFLDRHRG